MNRRYQSLYKTFFVFSDLFAINVINLVLVSYLSRYTTNYYTYTIFCIYCNIVWMVCSYATAMYVNTMLMNFKRLTARTLSSFIFYNFFLFLFAQLSSASMSITYIFYDILGFSIFLLFSRASYMALMTYLYKTDNYRKKIAFIGCNKYVLTLINYFRTNKRSTIIAGIFTDNKENAFEVPLLGNISDCIDYARENKITDIYSTLSPKAYPALYNLAQTAEKSFIRFKFVPDLTDYVDDKCQIDFIEDTAVISLRKEPLEDASNQIKKRIFDIIMSSLILLFILSWLIPVLAILIKIDSKGPVFFTQVRSGKNNEPFRVIKLRTLKQNPDADRLQVTRNDDRITKLGRFLRKSNLDELPQFFNVLMGDMSIVGSRPHMLKHTEEYSRLYDNYMLRHYTKPGITGWAQVNGFRGEIKEPMQLQQRVEHDIWYMENWNIWLDIKIIYLTIIKTVCGDKNAF
jgi:putative colanic acid biosysnthesis UDP-glucose lipid carrier transferase